MIPIGITSLEKGGESGSFIDAASLSSDEHDAEEDSEEDAGHRGLGRVGSETDYSENLKEEIYAARKGGSERRSEL